MIEWTKEDGGGSLKAEQLEDHTGVGIDRKNQALTGDEEIKTLFNLEKQLKNQNK